jgi:tRNA A-37 threonylcarbamoyl transferase component Bud32
MNGCVWASGRALRRPLTWLSVPTGTPCAQECIGLALGVVKAGLVPLSLQLPRFPCRTIGNTATSPLSGADPRLLGRYRLLARLGAGGMGVVYLGSENDGALVAVKVIRPEFAENREFRSRFRREVEVVARVDARFTARVLDHDVDAERPFLVTEYVDGPDLADAVRRGGALNPDQLIGLGVGLADALASIHAVGLVHRDVKPSNVLLGPDGPRLVDFGIVYAAEATELTETGVVTGTPSWMSPEQAQGRTTDAATDVFSWGTTVAFAGTGRAPFGEGRPDAVLYRVVHAEADLAGLPPEVSGAVIEALKKDPADRPPSRSLRDWCADRTVIAVGGDVDATAVVERTWAFDPRWRTDEDQVDAAALLPAPVETSARRGRIRLGRRLIFVGFVALLLIGAGIALAVNRHSPSRGVAIAATSTTTSTVPTTTTTTTTVVSAVSRTEQVVFDPFTIGGTPANRVETAQTTTGYCFGSSLSLSRADAYRCSLDTSLPNGGNLLDPCFANSEMQAFVLCVQDPATANVVRVNLTQPLPAGVGGSSQQQLAPWVLELSNGAVCTFLTGATTTVADMRLNYGCDTAENEYVGSVFGDPDRSTSVWTVFYREGTEGDLRQVSVTKAWM